MALEHDVSEPGGDSPPRGAGGANARNTMSGHVAGNSVQAHSIYGDVTIGQVRRRAWSRSWVLIIAVLIVAPIAGVGVALLRSSAGKEAAGAGQASASESAPLTVAVTVFGAVCMTTWVVPRPPDQIDLSAPIPGGDWATWEPAREGVAASPGVVFATVQGRTGAQVVLTDLKVRVHERREPFVGTNLRGICGDRGEFRWLAVDLDANPPKTMPVFEPAWIPVDAPDRERKPISFPYEVSLADAETFVIMANTTGCLCSWTAELSWASEGRTGTVTIDDHGKPFRTTPAKDTITCAPAEFSGGAGKGICR
jgi:hypothetical protein